MEITPFRWIYNRRRVITEDGVKRYHVHIQLFAMAPQLLLVSSSSQEYCCVVTGNTFPFTWVDPKPIQAVKNSSLCSEFGPVQYIGRVFVCLFFWAHILLRGGSSSKVFHPLLASILSTPPSRPAPSIEISRKNVDLQFYNICVKYFASQWTIYIEALEYFL